MLKLNSSRKLQALLAGAVATTQPACVVGYTDKTSSAFDGDAQLTDLNGATAVDVCAAPAAGAIRQIDYITLRNADSAEVVATIRINEGGTLHKVIEATLAMGEMLGFTHSSGWYVNSADGSRKSSATAAVQWGEVGGPLSAQTDLQAALDALQPLDSDLTAIAALTTTTYGRAFLALADAAAARTALALGTAATTAASDYDAAGAAAAAQAASQPLDSDLTAIAALTTTTFGRAVLALADAAALRTAAGLGTLATQSGTFSGTSSGTNTGDETGARIATLLHAASAKTTLVDADEVNGTDSAASFGLIRTTWTNVKAFLKTYFDTLYQAVLVSGTNIKTVNSTTLLGSGDIAISASPGGSTLQLQYNNASAFAGMAGTSWDNTNRALTVTGATVTTSNPVQSFTQTWNAGAVTFVGWSITITDTASAAASLVADFRVGASSVFTVQKNGMVNLAKQGIAGNTGTNNPGIAFGGSANGSIWSDNNFGVAISTGQAGAAIWVSSLASVKIPSGSVWGFSNSSTTALAPVQTGISSTGAAALAFGNGTANDFSASIKYTSSINAGVDATAAAAPTIASATTIAPTKAITFISGTTAIATITPPSPISAGGGQITLIPTGIFTTTTAGNIALATTAVVSKALTLTYDVTTTKWYPSY